MLKKELNKKKYAETIASMMERIAQEPQPKMIWDGIFEGSKGLIVGISKTGKTTFTENLVISMAVGRKEFFGKPMDGVPKKVLVVNFEERCNIRIRRNIKQLGGLTKEETELFYKNFQTNDDTFPQFISSDDEWEELREFIESSEADVVVIDSLSHMVTGKIEDSEVCLKFIKKFREYVGSTDKTIIVVHHNTKSTMMPIDQENIAGSRVVSQEFEYAIGFAKIRAKKGGKYTCNLYNKYVEVDENLATVYSFDSNGWIVANETGNKYDVHYGNSIADGRVNDNNKNQILNYFESQYSQGSIIMTDELMKNFVEEPNKVMAKDTLHNNLRKLMSEGKIKNVGHGRYSLTENEAKNGEERM